MSSQYSDINEAIWASGKPTLEEATRCAQEKINDMLNISLSIAVTGDTGAGKSTFINSIRNLAADDEGAAKTGVVETTVEPTPYQHPTMPGVVFWDLPGIGSSTFLAKTYLKQVQFDKYDFFIIISSERFRENDIMLAKEIQKRKKLFYFIRSKIDNDIRAESYKRSFNREETLSKIRRNCQENLKEFKNAKVFLINCQVRNLSEYDFKLLVSTLMSELSEKKKQALIQSVPIHSLEILEKKVKMFEEAVWAAALLSGGIAVVPLPGLSLACDASILVAFFTSCYHSFGLDDKSLERLSERVNKPHLKALRKSPLVLGLASESTMRLQLSALVGQSVVEYLCSLVPGVGSGIAALMSFGCTYKLLKNGLKDLADTARIVLREAGLQ
ncbi:interferon-inducible GTPase 5-like [Salminus brasiliensis]|uniref:interferon-inducible GTPase 5-like n=1 Tax=Salminus brasiliensis TaxID=930266 RepID=UPI003B8368DD